ncbi:MAG: GNAT family N-acetyltransferase [Sulfitobacter sp.]
MIGIAPTKDLESCYALRRKVFVDEQGYSAEGEVDALDPLSHHLLAHEDGLSVATARVYLEDGTAKIGRVCVLNTFRGTGLGAGLILAAVALARDHGAKRAVLGAQIHAVGFYEKLGFSPYGDVYADEGEPHQMMELSL